MEVEPDVSAAAEAAADGGDGGGWGMSLGGLSSMVGNVVHPAPCPLAHVAFD